MGGTVLEREHALLQDSSWQKEICSAAAVCFHIFWINYVCVSICMQIVAVSADAACALLSQDHVTQL